MTTRSLVGACLAASVLVAGGSALISPGASAAPALSVSVGSSDLPIAIPLADADGDDTNLDVTITSDSPATDVTITVSGDGITPSSGNYGSLPAGRSTELLSVSGSAGGLHAITVTVTAAGVTTPVSAVRSNVWVPGGTPITAAGSTLAGRSYGYQGFEDGEAESSVRDTEMLTFTNAGYAYDGLPPTGLPVCKHASASCLPYYYDPTSGLVQIGDAIIGKVLGSGLYTDGFIPPDEQDGELYSPYTATNPLVYVKAHTKLKGHWRFASADYPSGLVLEDLTLRKDGSYSLRFKYDSYNVRHLSGTYAITGPGKIVLKAHHKVAELGTLQAVAAPSGQAQPAKLGVWLTLSGVHGKAPDGNLLKPAKK